VGKLSKSYLKEVAERKKFQSGGFSTQGYKRNSPDVNNPYNVIPSNQITMRGVDFPVLGVDNMGNRRLMEPGNDYTFPGNYVTEFPIRNMGSKRFGQVGMQTFIYGRTNPANNSYVKPLNSVPLGLSKNITNIPYTKPVSQKPDPRNAMFLQSANIMPTTEAEKEIARIGNAFKNYENSQAIPKFTDNYYQTPSNIDNTYVRPSVEYKTTLPTPGQIAAEIEQEENIKNLLSKADSYMPALDVATDIMQLGNFIPHPIAQGIGKVGNVLGTSIDTYQASRDAAKGDYGSMGFNIASAALPFYLSKKGYLRPMQQVNNYQGKYRALGYLPGISPATRQAISPFINANRQVFGSLLGETMYDAGLFKNNSYVTNRGGFRDNTQLSPLYNLKNIR
jgi:hypothetical protein